MGFGGREATAGGPLDRRVYYSSWEYRIKRRSPKATEEAIGGGEGFAVGIQNSSKPSASMEKRERESSSKKVDFVPASENQKRSEAERERERERGWSKGQSLMAVGL